MKQHLSATVFAVSLILCPAGSSVAMTFPGEAPCVQIAEPSALPDMADVRLGMSADSVRKARPEARAAASPHDFEVPPFVLHDALFAKGVRTSATQESRVVLGRETVVTYLFYDDTLGAVTLSLRVGQEAHDTFSVWAETERQLMKTFGTPTLRAPYCLTKSCGDGVNRGLLSPEDVASRVGSQGLVGLHSVWGSCPMRVRVVASTSRVYVSFESRPVEQSLRDAYFREQEASGPSR